MFPIFSLATAAGSLSFALTEKVELAIITAVSSMVSAYFGYKAHQSARRTEVLQKQPRPISTDSEEGVFVQPPVEVVATKKRGKRGKRGDTNS